MAGGPAWNQAACETLDKSKSPDGTFSRSDFDYDHAGDLYHCPGGKELKQNRRAFRVDHPDVPPDDTYRYRASKADCERMLQERALYHAAQSQLQVLCAKGLLEVDTSPEVHMEGASNLLALDLRLSLPLRRRRRHKSPTSCSSWAMTSASCSRAFTTAA